jgi:hypothetical protein
MQFQQRPTPFSISPAPPGPRSLIAETIVPSNEPLHVQKMHAELELAEAELRAARIKFAYIQAKEQAEQEAEYGGAGTAHAPHTVK